MDGNDTIHELKKMVNTHYNTCIKTKRPGMWLHYSFSLISEIFDVRISQSCYTCNSWFSCNTQDRGSYQVLFFTGLYLTKKERTIPIPSTKTMVAPDGRSSTHDRNNPLTVAAIPAPIDKSTNRFMS